MNIHASMTSMVSLASSGLEKNAGVSQPSALARRGIGPNRNSSIDRPIIHETATGESISGSKNATRKNRRARISWFSKIARPNAITYSTRIARQ
jgi:hypothetical protein